MDLILQDITTEITFIEHRRIQFNLSVQDVVDELMICRSSYYRKIQGKSDFTTRELVKLGRLYGDNYKHYLDKNGHLVKGTVLLN